MSIPTGRWQSEQRSEEFLEVSSDLHPGRSRGGQQNGNREEVVEEVGGHIEGQVRGQQSTSPFKHSHCKH